MYRGLLLAGTFLATWLLPEFRATATDGQPSRSRGGGYGFEAHSPGFDRGYWRGADWNGGQPHHGHHHYHWHGGGLGWGYYGGQYGGYLPYSPYGIYYQPSANYVEYFLPPYYEPAELYYGPQAVKQFLGLDRNFALGPLREPPLRLPLVPAPAGGAKDAAGGKPGGDRAAVRVASPAMRRKAETYLAEGDALYRVQRFHSALQKYKLASRAAPDMPETHWRRGHALIATGNFELAAAAMKWALVLDSATARDGFRLDDLYGTAAMAKNVHQEILAEHVLENERSSDAWFLLGVFLNYDGQRERAEKFFSRALDLAAGEAAHVTAFLDRAAEPAPAPPAPAAAAEGPLPVAVGPGREI